MIGRPSNDFVIAHLTDLREDNMSAFEHAVALALMSDAAVVSVHASESPDADRPMPDARTLLAHWDRSDQALDFSTLVHRCCESPVDTILDAFAVLRPDLVVACTHRATGIQRVLRGSVSEAVARNAAAPALLVGTKGTGLVRPGGTLTVDRVLVPAENDACEARALEMLRAFLDRFVPDTPVELVLLQVCDCIPDPGVSPVGIRPGDTWRRIHDHGDVAAAITRAADANDADLIAMVSLGHDSVGDTLRGSVTERVLRTTGRPLLAFRGP